MIRPLEPGDLPAAAALLGRALPFDPGIEQVAEEKLLGQNPPGRAGGAFALEQAGALCGVAAWAGRWLKLLAVEPARGRLGHGSELLYACEDAVRAAGGKLLRTLDHPGDYLAPGLDVRYPIEFLLRHGFHEVGRGRNLVVSLTGNPLVSAARAQELDAAAGARGYAVRKLAAADHAAVLAMAAREFSPVWAFELGRALAGPPGGVWAAWSGGLPVAFAAHDANNRGLGWFGPAGTLAAHRGKRLGETLLLHCLLETAERQDHAIIAWIGPQGFYEKTAGARVDRDFIVLEKPL